jgi:hypothetical protein
MRRDLGIVGVATPCSASWDQMVGDDRVRHCGACQKNVYSVAELTADEVRALILEKEGKLCWRFFARADGTLLTKDCPVGLARVRRRAMAAMGAAAALVLAFVANGLLKTGCTKAAVKAGSASASLRESVVKNSPLRSLARSEMVMGDYLGPVEKR